LQELLGCTYYLTWLIGCALFRSEAKFPNPILYSLEVQLQVFQATVTKFGRDKVTEVRDQALTLFLVYSIAALASHKSTIPTKCLIRLRIFFSTIVWDVWTHHNIAERHPASGTNLELA
jgi:hypothetical protein